MKSIILFSFLTGAIFFLGLIALFITILKSEVDNDTKVKENVNLRQATNLTNALDDGIDDTVTAIVACETTFGPLIIDLRANWSPRGAQQFLHLVNHSFFDSVPFSRVCPKYITQFGIKYHNKEKEFPIPVIQDDRSLWGKRDINFGYLFYAGSGLNSRRDELVIALCESEGCKQSGLGAASWEVPFGTIRREFFPVLKKIEATGFPYPKLEMKGQHPLANGPDRNKILTDQLYIAREYPDIAFFKGCVIKENNIKLQRPIREDHPALLSATNDLSPFKVRFIINLGGHNSKDVDEKEVILEINPSWAPLGAKRFKELIMDKFYDECRFFRVIKGFMAQTGIAANPIVHRKWNHRTITDDPPLQSNTRGRISFAISGKNTRSTQVFINFGDNSFLDAQGFSPIGEVVVGINFIDKLYSGYGEGGKGDGSDGKGPSQGRLTKDGNKYLNNIFPNLSYIVKAEIV